VWNEAGRLEATNCEIHSQKNESGVMVRENRPSEAVLRKCRIHSNGLAGVVVEDKGFAKLHNCMIRDNVDGVLIQGSATVDIHKCTVAYNRSHGVFVGFDHKSGYVKVIKNRLVDNQGNGVFVGCGRSERVFLKDNEETNNKGKPNLSILPKHVMGTSFSGAQLRKWAIRVSKNPAYSSEFEGMAVESKIQVLTGQVAQRVLACAFCGTPAPREAPFKKCARCQALSYCSPC
jgi:Right handed beta helix region